LCNYVTDIRRSYRDKLTKGNAVTDEDIRLIIFGDDELGLKGDEKLKALAEMDFCFAPPSPFRTTLWMQARQSKTLSQSLKLYRWSMCVMTAAVSGRIEVV